MKKIILLSSIIFLTLILFITYPNVYADDFSDSINEQLEKIDLSGLLDFCNNIDNKIDIKELINSLINGDSQLDFNQILYTIYNIFLLDFKTYFPNIIVIISILLFNSVIQNIKSVFFEKDTTKLINYISVICIFLLLFPIIFSIYTNIKKTIQNLMIFNEIMTPIITTLMIATGQTVTASIFKPVVSVFTLIINSVFLNILLPLTLIVLIFSIVNVISDNISFSGFIELGESIIKWTIGIIIAVFSVYITIQGLTTNSFNSISIRASKYAISNSIPLIGGMLKDGFDFIVAGSVLIKNSIGIVGIIIIFYMVLPLFVKCLSLILLLKLVIVFTSMFNNSSITFFIKSSTKFISNLISILLGSTFMIFIILILSILCANTIL